MENTFFTQLEQLMNEDTDLVLKISKSDHQFIIALQPKSNNDKSLNKMPCLNIRGTAQELDRDFIRTIQKPLEKATGLIANLEWHDKAMASMEEKKKTALTAKTNKKTVKPSTTVRPISEPKIEEKKEEQPHLQHQGGSLTLDFN